MAGPSLSPETRAPRGVSSCQMLLQAGFQPPQLALTASAYDEQEGVSKGAKSPDKDISLQSNPTATPSATHTSPTVALNMLKPIKVN